MRSHSSDLLDRPLTEDADQEVYEKPKTKESWWKRLFIPDVLRGMMQSISHVWRPRFTVQYPDVRKQLPKRYRGEHRLKVDEEGHIKCVACYMCSTACPANCIHIIAQEAPEDYGPYRYKMPQKFEIDELRCIYCGYCVEACPEDAIEMTTKIPPVYTSRQGSIYDREKLLTNDGPSSEFSIGPDRARKGPQITGTDAAAIGAGEPTAAVPDLKVRDQIPSREDQSSQNS